MNFEIIREKLKHVSKQEILTVLICVILVMSASVCFFLNVQGVFETSTMQDDFETNEEILVKNEISDEPSKIKVYIAGEVNSPGVIELFEGERIEDAIEKAEGLTNSANLDNVNLAYKLEDGQKIYIPNTKDEEDHEIISTNNGDDVIKENLSNSKASKVNINLAGVDKLCEIPGVGKALAQRIISYREQNGKFNNIEELKNVSGIGEKKFEGMKEFVVIK